MNINVTDPLVKQSELESAIGLLEKRLKNNWFQRNAPAISATAAVFALVVGSIYYYKQVGLTQRAIQNNLIYQMQKDERAAVAEYSSGKMGSEYIFAQMQSIFLQEQMGSIPPETWKVFVRDFCGVFKHENFKRSWDDVSKTNSAAFSIEFTNFMNDLKMQNLPACK